MSEDQLLRELGHLAREERETEKALLDERWDRLAAGTLTTEEDAELRALAAASPEAREAYEAFRPLGAEFQARVVAAISAEIDRRKETERSHFFDFLLALSPPARWLTAAGTVAAGLLYLLLRFVPPMAPLPVYALVGLAGGESLFRGEAAAEGEQIFIPGSRLTVIARPATSVKGEVKARAYLARGGEWISWKPKVELDDGGSVRLQGDLPEIRPGDWTVWVVVGRPWKLPSLSDLQSAVREGRIQHDEWQAVSRDLRVRERPPP